MDHDLIRGIISPPREPGGPLSEEELARIRKYIVGTKVDDFLLENGKVVSLPSIYPFLFTSLLQSPGLGDYRTLACDALAVWVQRASQCCSKSSVFAAHLRTKCTATTEADTDMIFDFMCVYWTDSGAALGNAIRELFMKTISLVERIWTLAEKRERLIRWLDRILEHPRTMRVVYFTIEILAGQLGGRIILQKEPALIRESLLLTYSNALANPVSKMINSILVSVRKLDISALGKKPDLEAIEKVDKEWMHLWAGDFIDALKDDNLRPHLQIYLLPNIFRVSRTAYLLFLNELSDLAVDEENSMHIRVCCLKVGQDLGLLDDEHTTMSVLSPAFLRSLLHHSSLDIRIGGLSLAVSSPKASKPIPSLLLDLVAESFDDFFLESDAEFRNRVYGFMRQMVTRIRDSSIALYRAKHKLKSSANDAQIQANVNFMHIYIKYLQQLLRPGSSHQRIHNSLRLFTTLARSGLDGDVDSKWHEKNHFDFPFHIPIFTHNVVRLLIDCLVNNYEDIREDAAALLKMAPIGVLVQGANAEERKTVVDQYAEKGFTMITGLRGREGDGAARIINLCYYLFERIDDERSLHFAFLDSIVTKLEQAISEADLSLSDAVIDFPLHGYFTSLRLIFEKIDFTEKDYWSVMLGRIIALSHSVWRVVERILSHDAPEGNLPDEIEENYLSSLEEQYGPATQVILSYAWRAISESSGLLTAIFSRAPDELLSYTQVHDLGELLLVELATIRHRGAFSSIYPTFVACCTRCNGSSHAPLRALPEQWLDENIELIQRQAQVITRRSGGLPYLVTGVLAAEPHPDRPLLRRTFERLAAIAVMPANFADDKVSLPQVHALNCIKSIFVEARLSAASAYYVDRALAMAIAAFASEVWSIRNCGVMLFAALQTRLFGSSKATESRSTVGNMSARLFFSKYKQIKDILLRHLELHVHQMTASETSHVETVYPVLSLLSRLEGTSNYTGLEPFHPLIMSCLSSRIWKIRENAAWSLIALVNTESWDEMVCGLFSGLSPASQNANHGRLLAVQAIMEKFARNSQHPINGMVYEKAIDKFPEVMNNRCAPNAILFIRICKLLMDGLTNDVERKEHLRQQFTKFLSQRTYKRRQAAGDKLLEVQSTEYFAEYCVQQLIKDPTDPAVGDLKDCLSPENEDACIASLKVIDSHVSEITPDVCQSLSQAVFDLFHVRRIAPHAVRVFAALASRQDQSVYTSSAYSAIVALIDAEIIEQDPQSEAAIEALGVFAASMPPDQDCSFFLTITQRAAIEDMPFSVRQAGLVSRMAYVRAKRLIYGSDMTGARLEDMQVQYMALLDALNEDDEELRDMATEFLCREILQLPQVTTGVYCKKLFIQYLVESAGQNSYIEIHASKQLSEFADEGFEAAFNIDTALFVIEPPNLYRDRLSDTIQWAQICENAANPKVQSWEVSAIQRVLPDMLDAVKRKGYDGPLGWASDAEVFLRGARVIELYYVLKRLGGLSAEMEHTFREIAEVSKQNSVHFMWDFDRHDCR